MIPQGKALPTASGSETVLIAEDETTLLKMTLKILRSLGYGVLTARNGQEALGIIHSLEKPVDLVVTDIVMPGVDGIELGLYLRSKWPKVRILFVSGYPFTSEESLRRLGSDVQLLRKPFKPQILAEKIRNMLDTPEEAA